MWAKPPGLTDRISDTQGSFAGRAASMKLPQLINDLPLKLVGGPADTAIARIVDDSHQVAPGTLFVARAGTKTDGKQFIADALARGAVAVLAASPLDVPAGVAMITADDVAAAAIALAMKFHGEPMKRLRLVGITGTKGKTTTAYMVRHLVQASGHKCGLIGTVEIDDGATREASNLTTPGALELIELLGRMVRNGCDTAVMEVSSHALHQGRVSMLNFAVGVFTNLTGDHLDYHKTMDNYAAAKAILFERLAPTATAVVNADDAAAPRMLRDTKAKIIRFTLTGQPAEMQATITEAGAAHTDATVRGPWGSIAMHLPAIGGYNVANMLGALGAAHALGLDVTQLPGAIANFSAAPGRLEPVHVAGLPFTVLVDYAHTDGALENVLTALRARTQNKLRVLFGCGGDRDNTKRPRMAAVACRLADRIVITSDNPRTENPESIIQQILAGVPVAGSPRVTTIADRAAAIRRIIADAEPGDVVVLAGKGHEDYQIIGTTKRHFDDREHARAAMEERARSAQGSIRIAS
jgi:UDP-N-acetylmuramyl-tripeptide synthetase